MIEIETASDVNFAVRHSLSCMSVVVRELFDAISEATRGGGFETIELESLFALKKLNRIRDLLKIVSEQILVLKSLAALLNKEEEDSDGR